LGNENNFCHKEVGIVRNSSVERQNNKKKKSVVKVHVTLEE